MLRLIILLNVLTLQNIYSRELVVPQVVQSEQIIISSSPINQKVTEELVVASQNEDTEYQHNKLNISKELFADEEDLTLSSDNLAVKTHIHENNSKNMSEQSCNNAAEAEFNNENRVNNKPLDIISQGKTPLIVPTMLGTDSSSNKKITSPGKPEDDQSRPGEATNDTNVSLEDRSSFNGDKCPTGYVRINEQCIPTE